MSKDPAAPSAEAANFRVLYGPLPSSRDMNAYMRAYRQLKKLQMAVPPQKVVVVRKPRRRTPPAVLVPLHDAPQGHCVFCALETSNADGVCNVCQHELAVRR